MATELATDEQLKAASMAAFAKFQHQPGYQDWTPKLADHLKKVKGATRDEFFSAGFQEELWGSEAVSATGMGRIDVSKVTSDPQIVQMLWDLKIRPFPGAAIERVPELVNAWNQITEAVKPLVAKMPRLKMYRVFAALFPADFTTIAHARKLRSLARAMGIPEPSSRHPIELNHAVLDRLKQVLGNVDPPPAFEGVNRMSLPWLLYAAYIQEQEDEATAVVDPAAGTELLKPLPAARRRKGLLAIAGFLPTIRSMIEFANEGCTREDLKEHIRAVNPRLADNSIGTNINALIAEWGVVRASGNELHLTPRGEALLESGDPEEVSDWLLTRILGFDNLLARLKQSPASSEELASLLQKVNPGWTSRFAPDVLIKWVRSLGLAEAAQGGLLRLTPEGTSWVSRIHWEPESLPTDSATAPEFASVGAPEVANPAVQRPTLAAMMSSFPATASFPQELVARLDAGLWHNERRHFAVLTGLSGAGKTLLAKSYGLSLWAGGKQPTQGLFILPVQPGWHDPSCILGYVNPLVASTYVRTGFLEFLLRAVGDPSRPYTVVLDEMNLSHPEQYFAPLLSAMETGEAIEFHTFDEEISGVPPRVPYPSNLVIVGTVNMDETTHGLSDKVLDRACVIDFWDVDAAAYPGWKTCGLDIDTQARIRDVLLQLGSALRPVRLHFGWRTIEDVVGYVRSALGSGSLNATRALDHAIYGKVLTKLRGEDTDRLRVAFGRAIEVLKASSLNESASKLGELTDDLRQTGSARFWR